MCLKIINVNPSKRKTEDSFVRSLTIALNISYKDVEDIGIIYAAFRKVAAVPEQGR